MTATRERGVAARARGRARRRADEAPSASRATSGLDRSSAPRSTAAAPSSLGGGLDVARPVEHRRRDDAGHRDDRHVRRPDRRCPSRAGEPRSPRLEVAVLHRDQRLQRLDHRLRVPLLGPLRENPVHPSRTASDVRSRSASRSPASQASRATAARTKIASSRRRSSVLERLLGQLAGAGECRRAARGSPTAACRSSAAPVQPFSCRSSSIASSSTVSAASSSSVRLIVPGQRRERHRERVVVAQRAEHAPPRARGRRACAPDPRGSRPGGRASTSPRRATHGSGCSSVSASRTSTSAVVARRAARGRDARARAAGGRACRSTPRAAPDRQVRRPPAAWFCVTAASCVMPSAISRSIGSVSPGTASANEIQAFASSGAPESTQNHSRSTARCRAARAVAGVAEPAQRGDHVVLLGLQAAEPVALLGAAQLRLGPVDERGEAAARGPCAWPRPRPPRRASPARTRGSSRASGSAAPGTTQRALGERGEPVEHVVDAADGGGGLLGRARLEHGEPARERALVVVEQAPAPVDHRAQRAVARQRGAAAAGEQPEAVVEARGELLDGHRPQPRGGQLDRQRQAVEPPADLRDRRRRARTRARRRGRGRGTARSRDRRRAAGPGRGSRRRSPAARGWWRRSAGPGRRPSSRSATARPRHDQVLAVVEEAGSSRGRSSASSRRSSPSRGDRARAVEHRARRAGRARPARRGRSRPRR